MTDCRGNDMIAGLGEVHDGLWAGMHQSDPLKPGNTALNRLVRVMRHEGKGKQIFICGHSMGGALASFLALLLTARCAAIQETIVPD